jgi:hypothetical protein
LGDEWEGLPAPVKHDGDVKIDNNEIEGSTTATLESEELEKTESVSAEKNISRSEGEVDTKTQTPEVISQDDNMTEGVGVEGLERQREKNETVENKEQKRNRETKNIYPQLKSVSLEKGEY